MTETWQTPDSPVFVTLGGTTLTQADLDAYIQDRIPEKHQAGFLSDPNRIASVVQQQLLQLLLAHQGIKHGLDEEPEIAALLYHKAMSELAKQEIKRYLAEHQLDSYSAQAEELAIVEPDAVQSEMFTVSFDQLLVTGQDDESRLDTAVRMADLYERYKEGELDFDALIKHSDDPALDDNNGRYADIDPSLLDEGVAAMRISTLACWMKAWPPGKYRSKKTPGDHSIPAVVSASSNRSCAPASKARRGSLWGFVDRSAELAQDPPPVAINARFLPASWAGAMWPPFRGASRVAEREVVFGEAE